MQKHLPRLPTVHPLSRGALCLLVPRAEQPPGHTGLWGLGMRTIVIFQSSVQEKPEAKAGEKGQARAGDTPQLGLLPTELI